jgi:hypothetical protein
MAHVEEQEAEPNATEMQDFETSYIGDTVAPADEPEESDGGTTEPAKKPRGKAAKQADEPADEPAQDKEPPTPGEKQPEKAAVIDPDKIKIRYKGRDLTLTEAIKEGVLPKLQTSAEQQPHFQKIADERKKELEGKDKTVAELVATVENLKKQIEESTKPKTEAKQQDDRVTPEQVTQYLAARRREIAPVLEEVKKGLWGEDWIGIVDAFPEVAADLIAMYNDYQQFKAGATGVLSGFSQAQTQASESLQKQAMQQEGERFKQEAFSWMGEFANSQPVWGQPLRDPKVRDEFFVSFVKENAEKSVDQITPDMIQGAWFAYLHRRHPEAFQELQELAQSHKNRNSRLAGGERGGTGPVGTRTEYDEFAADVLGEDG